MTNISWRILVDRLLEWITELQVCGSQSSLFLSMTFDFERWIRNRVPALYLLDRRQQQAIVAESFQMIGGIIIWVLFLQRHLQDSEVPKLALLLVMLERVHLWLVGEDERLWSPDSEGQFSVKSCYDALNGGQLNNDGKRFGINWSLPEF